MRQCCLERPSSRLLSPRSMLPQDWLRVAPSVFLFCYIISLVFLPLFPAFFWICFFCCAQRECSEKPLFSGPFQERSPTPSPHRRRRRFSGSGAISSSEIPGCPDFRSSHLRTHAYSQSVPGKSRDRQRRHHR